MRILFVTHDVSIYGASRSLQTLIAALPDDVSCDLVVPQSLFGSVDVGAIRAQFQDRVGRIILRPLPFFNAFVGKKPNLTLKDKLWLFTVAWLTRMTRKSFLRLVKEGGYDAVHLNSLVLVGLCDKSCKSYLHVRELWDGEGRAWLRKCVSNATGVIFIDHVVRKPFAEFQIQRSIILENPINMLGVGDKAPIQLPSHTMARIRGRVVFAIIGKVTAEKGISFILDAIAGIKGELKKFVLVIVGDGELRNLCQNASATDDHIVYWGEEPDMTKIYSIADYVIRAEDEPRVGRTVYEAIFAGCSVILPGTPSDYPKTISVEFSDRVHYYAARDKAKFVQTLIDASQNSPYRGTPISNASNYAQQFVDFLRTS